jgi:hypothetical protein
MNQSLHFKVKIASKHVNSLHQKPTMVHSFTRHVIVLVFWETKRWDHLGTALYTFSELEEKPRRIKKVLPRSYELQFGWSFLKTFCVFAVKVYQISRYQKSAGFCKMVKMKYESITTFQNGNCLKHVNSLPPKTTIADLFTRHVMALVCWEMRSSRDSIICISWTTRKT